MGSQKVGHEWSDWACIFKDWLKIIICFHYNDFPGGSDGKESAYNEGDLGLIPGSGKSPGEGNGNQF